MGFLQPAVLLLAVPVLMAWWRLRGAHPVTSGLRLLFALLLLAGLAGPYLSAGAEGRDLVLVVDRSRSMPAEANRTALELVGLAEKERRAEDRIYVVSYGAEATLEHAALEEERFPGFEATVNPDGSDLASALETALDLLDGKRPASLMLISDGLHTGRDPLIPTRRAYTRGVRIDVRHLSRSGSADLSVERIELPGDVAVGEPFQFQVWVHADQAVTTEFSLAREGRVLSTGVRDFPAGRTRLVFRDRLEIAGVAEYDVELSADDRIPENNRARAAVRARGARALLVLNNSGSEDTLVRALRKGGLRVAVAAPESVRLDPVGLSRYRAVILENVPAARLGPNLPGLASWVREHGGGLLMTGGESSFGVGGYYLSPVEEVLPVTMELRQEHRKLSMAMAVALDRSGSMGAPVGGAGSTKMDLANLGTWAALELLSPMDHVSVIAVDSAPHVILPMQSAQGIANQRSRVLGIQSMGGGIYVYEALKEVMTQLAAAPQTTQHIVLFSDAADSEQQAGCFELIAKVREERGPSTTLSVVALGTEGDSDADFLKELARIGGGTAYFTVDPGALPRLFAQDTLTVSRSTFVTDPTGVALRPDLVGLGAVPIESFPELTGYNLTYLRPQTQQGLITTDEFHAPIFAFGFQGLGRSAAFTPQVGGSLGSEITAWNGFAPFFTTLARWLVGTEEPGDVFVDTRREGRDVVISLELDPEAELEGATARLTANLTTSKGITRKVSLLRTGAQRFEARVALEGEGALLGTVELADGRALPLPPLVLPYSPEFERSPDPQRGERLLRRIAKETGGALGASIPEALAGARSGAAWRLITRELMLAALLVMLVEIAGRRLSLWGSLARRLPKPQPRAASKSSVKNPKASPRTTDAAPKPDHQANEAAPEPAAPESGMGSALDAARRAAERKLER